MTERSRADRLLGLSGVRVRPSSIEALASARDSRVPYGPRSAVLGLDRFPLALDGDAHGRAAKRIGEAIEASSAKHDAGVEAATQEATKQLRIAGGRVDVGTDVVDRALARWVETWFGLERAGVDLQRAGRLIAHAMFFNPPIAALPTDEGGLLAVIEQLDRRRADLLDVIDTAESGTLVAALRDTEDEVREWDLVVDDVLGLTVGPLALGSTSILRVIDALLDRPWELEAVRSIEEGTLLFHATLAWCPPLPGFFRDTPHGRVLALTQRPRLPRFIRRRMNHTDALVFGHGPHACMGRAQMGEVAGAILLALAPHRPRRAPGVRGTMRDDPSPTGVRRWPFKSRLEVDLRY